METGLDKISMEGGYPSEESVGKLYDEIDFQRACQAYIWATPAVEMEVLADGLKKDLGLAFSDVGIFENFLDAKTVLATGNGQSLYSFGCFDLSKTGPVVLEIPAGILGFLMTGWQQPIEDLGPLGPDKGKGGSYLIIPPGHDAAVPRGYFPAHSDTMLVNWLVRGFVKNGKPDSAIHDIKGMRIYPLADKEKKTPMRFINVSGKKATLVPIGQQLEGLEYFEKLHQFIQREPVRIQDKQFLGMLAPLGIEKGKPFALDSRTKSILADAAKVGRAMAATISYESRHAKKLRWPGKSRWEELILTEHPDYVNPNYEELDSRAALYYQAAGASKSILKDVVGAGSKYAAAFKDGNGDWLNGSKSYQLHVPPNPPAKDFWSVTVYDANTRSMIDTSQGRSGRDSYAQLEKNSDGSVDLYFGPTSPSQGESNWVKTIPEQGFFLYFRWYGPLQAYFDKSWYLPDVTLRKASDRIAA